MSTGTSLQRRLAIAVGLSVTLLWLAAAAVTAHRLDGEMRQVFDDGLKATAQRILPIARHDIREGHSNSASVEHDDEEGEQDDDRTAPDREARYGEDVTFVVRDGNGRILLASRGADAAIVAEHAIAHALSEMVMAAPPYRRMRTAPQRS